MAYTYGSRQATNLQVNAGIMLTPGVRRALEEHIYKLDLVHQQL